MILFFDEYKVKIFYNIINDFTVTFDQFNVPLLNKSCLFLNNIITPI